MIQTINIAQDYTKYPGGRYLTDGAGNGTNFRNRFLLPVLRSHSRAVVELDGVAGYPSSFLDEAFAGLVRTEGFSADEVITAFDLKAEQPGFARFADMIRQYVREARPGGASRASAPTKP